MGGGMGGVEDEAVWNLLVPATVAPAIIGRGGQVINNIQQSSGARVDVPKMADGKNKCVTFKGPPESKAIAMEHTLHTLAESREFAVDGEIPPIRFQIPREAVPKIIGAGGKMISQISDMSNARIDVEKEGNGPNRSCTLAGDVDAIVSAASYIFPLCHQALNQ